MAEASHTIELRQSAGHWAHGTVVAQRRWAEGLYSITIDAGPLEFEAGQFTRIALDIDGEEVARPYSFVNAPRAFVDAPRAVVDVPRASVDALGQQHCEFYYGVVPGGPLTARLPE